jgi:hypothetical protein
MKLNASQIEQLFLFTRKHYVEWYDLQLELVDHLANGIEKQWQQHPDLIFEDALQKEFKKFGVFGFMDVVEERQNSLTKKYSKLIWKHLIEYFKIPKIILLLLCSAFVFYLLRTLPTATDYFMGFMVVVILAYFIILLWSKHKNSKKTQELNEKRWLFKDIIIGHGAGTGFALLPIHFFNILLPNTGSLASVHPAICGFISFFTVLVFVIFYVMQVEIPKKVDDYLNDTYPEYSLVD